MPLLGSRRGRPRAEGLPAEGLPQGEFSVAGRAAELQAVFDALGDGLIVVDAVSRVVEVNQAMVRMLGARHKDELLGPLAQGLYARCQRADGSPLHREDLGVHRVLRDGDTVRGELTTRLAADDPRSYECLTTPILARDGRVLGATMVIRDVTEQRQREHESAFIAATSELVAASFDARATMAQLADRCVGELADWCAVYLFDDDGNSLLRPVSVRHRNPKLAALMAGEQTLRPLRVGEGFAGAAVRAEQTLVLPDLTDDVILRYARGARDASHIRKFGLRAVVAAPLRGAHGVVGALALGWAKRATPVGPRDVWVVDELARRAALAIEQGHVFDVLEEALGRLELVLTSLPLGLAIFGNDGRTILVNRYARDLFGAGADPQRGLTAEEWLRRGAASFGTPTVVADVAARLADREVSDRGALRILRPKERDVDWLSEAVRDRAGEAVGQVVALIDVTDIRATERVREEFAADLSGALRTPVNAVSNFAMQALRRAQRTQADATLIHQLEGVARNARQISVLTADLLDVARMEVAGGEVSRSEVDVVPLIEQAIDQVRAMTALHRFRLDAPATLPPALWDANLVRRAVVNILTNAVKYWPEGGQIGVRVRPQADGVIVSVRDRGLGIPPDRLEQVFERFVRIADDPARRGIRGNGLGLYLVREVVEAHDGTAWIQSNGIPGDPTTVHVLLPWRPSPPTAAGEAR